MATPSTLNAVIARVAAGLYDMQLGYATMDWAVTAVTSNPAYGGNLSALVQSLYATDIQTNANAANLLVTNLVELQVPTLDATLKADLVAYVTGLLDAGGAGNEGATIISIVNGFASLTTHPDATISAAATSFNAQITAAIAYAAPGGAGGAPDVIVHVPFVQTTFFTIVPETAAGADVMHLTGNQDVRIDFTNMDHQIRGLDLDGDGLIEADGSENNPTFLEANVTMIADHHAGFEIVDAYSRNPLNHTDTANNFLGDIAFDGTGYKGDGVSTNGNIFLGGLGVDTAFAGDGNDFMAGGQIAQGRTGMDTLRGGRNADFFFAEFSGIDATDGGPTLFIDGGNTSDNTSAGDHGPQDADWLLFEASDDDEPVRIILDEVAGTAVPGDTRNVTSRSGETMDTDDVENFDASGNLYGFLDNVDVEIGGRAIDDRDASTADVGYNYGLGSTAQLDIQGSQVGNILIAGYDNDKVYGQAGNDLLFGGNLKFLNNPNSVGIVNDGRDELFGGSGNDNIVFEADGGLISGDGFRADATSEPAPTPGDDTLWLTNYALGLQTATDLTSDGFLRFDLKAQTLATAAGYGGADVNGTQDQTNYKGATRVTMTDMESVIATGLGAVDYAAAGSNDPELLFANQQNQARYNGNLDLRGTEGTAGVSSNTLYASGGADVLEGRSGDDMLSGGDGNDDFYFGTSDAGDPIGDHVDVIHRQTDADGDNLWDGFDATTGSGGLFERDFNIGGTSSTGASVLKVAVQKAGGNTAGTELNQVVNFVSEIVTGVMDGGAFVPITLNTTEIKAATTYQGLTDAINAALDATAYGADLQATLQADGFTIFIADAQGRELADSSLEVTGAGVSVNQIANTATQNTFEYGAPAVAVTKDRLIYKSYEDRNDNEGTDDDSVLGSIISLGIDSYAEDLVINFADEDADGLATTRIAEDQAYDLVFTNLTTQDRVQIEVNGVKYTLQVGVDLDGNIIANEDGVGDSQTAIQHAFLNRLAGFINSFMDDDTSAGKVTAAVSASGASGTIGNAVDLNGDADVIDANEPIGSATFDTITLTQAAYNGEETVFMVMPIVTLSNLSGGEPAEVTVTNVSQHEVELLDFDGRNGELNETNVLFWGQEAINRATLETALTAGSAITGKEAIVIDVGPNNLQDVVFGTTTAIANNTATNFPLSAVPNGWSVHGDDFMLGGDGLDTISGGTGDDRVEGSIGGNGTTTWDTLDGGKNFYAIQVLGEPQARVYILNKWEAANPTKVTALTGLVISSITLIDQNETGTFVSSGVFDDTLQFSQKLFTPGVTRFTITLDNFTLTGGVVELRNDGAGTVGVDVDGNGTIDNWTRFTNFENIRTVAGVGNAVAGDGQGNDTLNVSALSSATTGANGILYNLTNGAVNGFAAGSVLYSADAHASLTKPEITDFEALVLRVDGVESVIGGTGDDLLVIDETEAAKNNTFTGDLGDDRIIYQNDFGTLVGEPTITIKVDTVPASLGGTDTVTSTAGRVGSIMAVDTLNGVEYISLQLNTAQSVRENDVLDVTSLTTGATVSYIDGTVKSGGTTHVTIDGIVGIERINGNGGNDVVIVADADAMNNNLRSDEGVDATPAQNILFMTYRDFDDLNTNATTRKTFAAQVADNTIQTVINQGQFTFALNESGVTNDVDRVDYSAELGRIVVPVGQGSATNPQYVVVDGDNDQVFSDAESRVDVLRNVEEIVAAMGRSVLDFTDVGQARQITFQYTPPAANPAENGVLEQAVRIADANGNTISGLNAFIERYTYNKTTAAVADATWNQIEGSDAAEIVIYQGSEDLVNQAGLDHRYTNDVLTLRGGNNEVRYSPLETSITAVITVTEEDTATTNVAEGLISASITFQDGLGVNAPSATFLGGLHTITSHSVDNSTAAGNLKIEGSQDAEDVVQFAGLSEKTFLLGTSPGVIQVNIGTANSMTLTGFEFLQDSATSDIYNFASLVATTGLTLLDTAGDHDVIKVGNDAAAAAFNGGIAGNTTISLSALNTFFTFDFDVLDISSVNLATLTTVNGELLGLDDELVIGVLGTAATTSVTDFEAVVVSNAAIAAHGTSFVLNTTADSLVIGAKTLQFNGNMNSVSFGGTMLGDTGVPHATTAVTVTMVGNEAATIVGGDGADSITTNGGADTIRGGAGNDTLSGGFTAAVGPVLVVTMNGGGATLTADGDNITIAGATLLADAAPVAFDNTAIANEIITGADSDQVGAAFASLTLATWITALQTAGATAAEAGALTSVSYNAVSNALTFQFNNSANGSTLVLADVDSADLTGGTITAVEAFTAFVASTESADTYVFEATAALNGADTINNFNMTGAGTDDLLDFTAFLGAAGSLDTDLDEDAATEVMTLAGGENIGVFYNSTALTSGRVEVAGSVTIANGDVVIGNDGKAVVLVTADTDGGTDATNQGYAVYFVQDTDATAGFSPSVTLVGTINSLTELNAFDFSGANFV